ncbi:MAG: HEAT repeat domain-containing protein [Planctomycetes bacterium]|nr:HEAT repeat domain-containing protein [Planctomycetota bacterium]
MNLNRGTMMPDKNLPRAPRSCTGTRGCSILHFLVCSLPASAAMAEDAAGLVRQIERAENPARLAALGAEAIPALLHGLETSEHKDVILHLLGEIGDSRALPAITRFTQDAVIEHRIAAVYALRKFKTQEATSEASKALSDKEERVRSAALQALRALEARTEAAGVARLLSDPEWPLRKESARLLGDFKERDATPALVARLRFQLVPETEEGKTAASEEPKMIPRYDESVASVRMEAIQSLGKIGAPDAVQAFIPLLAHGSDAERRAAVDALQRMGHGVADLVHQSIRYPSKEDKPPMSPAEILQSAYLAVALARLADDRAVKAALSYAPAGDPFCQIELVQFLGNRKVAESAPVLAQMLRTTKVKQVNEALGSALTAIGQPASAALLELLPDRTVCVEVMGLLEKPELQNAKAIEKFIKYLEDEDFDIRSAAIKALVAHRATEAVASLESTRLLDPDERVRDAATDALKALTGKDYRK